MKDRIYDLSFKEVNQVLNLKFYNREDFQKFEKSFYSLQSRLKTNNWKDLVGNRFSWLFIRDLVELNCYEEVLSIVNEIEHLERPERFKSHSKEVQISKKGLKGLHYKHYIEGGFLPIQKLYLQKYGTHNSLYNKEINAMFYERIKHSDQKPLYILLNLFKEQFLDHFLMRLGVEDDATLKLKKRLQAEGKPIKKITGEFFVFHQYENKNYYLALWKHHDKSKQDSTSYEIEELKKAQQIKIYCEREFPEFSKQILSHI
jgi:hypothetical protein